MTRRFLTLGLLALAAALATLAVAWWVMPLVGLVYGVVSARRGKVGSVAIPLLAGFLGWGGLLLVDAVQGGAGRVATVMGGVLGLPSWALFIVAPAYGALLCAGGALLGSGLVRRSAA